MDHRRSGRFSFLLFSAAVAPVVLGGGGGCDRSRPRGSGTQAPPAEPSSMIESQRRTGSVESAQASQQGTPASATTDLMKHADQDMAQVLAELQSLGGRPIETLTPAQAREQPSPADAVKSLLKKQGKSTEPEAVAKVEDREIPRPGGKLPVRIYTPTGGGTLPVIVYFHGGGFVIASNDTYDATPRALANGARAIVVAVEYRKAPEYRFPAAHDDANAAYQWVVKHADSFDGDAKRVAVAGESAGANLAENVAIFARDHQQRRPLHVLLVYPIASAGMSSESYEKYRDAKPLNKSMMAWFSDHYLRSPKDARDPRLDLLNAKLTSLPETTIINAELDPLLSDGKALAEKLEAAEVQVKQKTYDGVTHEFFGMGAVVSDAKDAMQFACDRLRGSFEAAANAQETALSGEAAKP
jgi:acetyl esterase/lipase